MRLQNGIGDVQDSCLKHLSHFRDIIRMLVSVDIGKRAYCIQNALTDITDFINIFPIVLEKLGLEQFYEFGKNAQIVYEKNKKLFAEEQDDREILSILNAISVIIGVILEQKKDKFKTCVCCGEKVYYNPLPIIYKREMEKYGAQPHIPETLNDNEYTCPCCSSSDRDRLIINFLKICGLDEKNCNEKVLQIAPSIAIEHWINANCFALTYHSTDLYMDNVTFKADVQNMKEVKDNFYDYFICSHVLEHVKNDRVAMKELHRILKSDGIGIFLVPIGLDVVDVDEEWGLTEAENWRRFGQGDHCRLYEKKNMIKRLEEAGFFVHSLGKDFFGTKVFEEAGLSDTSTLYILTKENIEINELIEKKKSNRKGFMTEEPLVSVIMSAYNHEKYVGRTIESVLNQSYTNFEFLVADDCSSDGTVSEILKFEDQLDEIHLFDVNGNDRFKFLANRARGKYIAVINSDDEWEKTKLESQVIYLESHPECAACFTGCRCINEDNEELDGPFLMENHNKENWFLHFYESGNCLAHPSILIKREVYKEIGVENVMIFRQIPDFMMWINLVQKYEIHVIEKSLVTFKYHEHAENENVSANSEENLNRYLVENTYLWYKTIKELDDFYFLKTFEKYLKNKQAKSKYQVMCEKFFVLLNINYEYSKQAAIFYMYDIYQIPEVFEIFKSEYGFTCKDLYRLVVEVGPIKLGTKINLFDF